VTCHAGRGHPVLSSCGSAVGPPEEASGIMILVTGATGNVGRPLTAELVARGEQVRAVTRHPRSAGLPAGVEAVAEPDLRGVTALFVNPRALGDGAGALVLAARSAGVERIVGLAAANVDDDPARQPSRFRGDRNREVEQAVTTSGGAWVSLRPAVFAANAIGMWGAALQAGDAVHGPYAAAVAVPVDERDVAAVAAVALTSAVLDGTRPVLTGPEALDQAQMLEHLGTALGRSLRFVEVPPDAARAALVAQGFPDGFADAWLAMQAAAVVTPPRPTGEVQRILGRPPRSFTAWATDRAAAFGRAA
jgi:uncharacterized protein YbjT (DUF2867 family)